MKRIPLTQSKFAIVDDEDFEWLNQWKWGYEKHGKSYRVVRKATLSEALEGKTTIYMHRLIMNAQKGKEVDHINHNQSDNRKVNLRLCTKSQNQQNSMPRLGTTSKYKGVYLNKTAKRWIAQITYNYRLFYLGCFEKEVNAAKAYDQKAKELFGDFAHTNFSLAKQGE